jgi:ATPase subunit of ABC transporter with duplicated ATPase domains
VSHDRRFLDRCVDHVVALEKSTVRVVAGRFSTWKQQRDREQESERRRRGKLERELRALTRAAREQRRWSGRREREKRGAYDKGFIGARAARQMRRALRRWCSSSTTSGSSSGWRRGDSPSESGDAGERSPRRTPGEHAATSPALLV